MWLFMYVYVPRVNRENYFRHTILIKIIFAAVDKHIEINLSSFQVCWKRFKTNLLTVASNSATFRQFMRILQSLLFMHCIWRWIYQNTIKKYFGHESVNFTKSYEHKFEATLSEATFQQFLTILPTKYLVYLAAQIQVCVLDNYVTLNMLTFKLRNPVDGSVQAIHAGNRLTFKSF